MKNASDIILFPFCKEICITHSEILSIPGFQDTVFPIYNFHYIDQLNLSILFIAGNSNVDILFFQKKLPFMPITFLLQPSWEHFLINICHSVCWQTLAYF